MDDHTTQAEPAIAVLGDTLLVVYVDTRHFLPRRIGESTMIGHALSRDGGVSFQDLGGIPPCSTCLGSTNPSLARAPSGVLFLANLQDSLYGNRVGVARSYDGGETFTPLVLIPSLKGPTLADLPQVVTSPTTGEVFVIWTDLLRKAVLVSSSGDGQNFREPTTVIEGGAPKQFARLVVGQEGVLYCFWLEPLPTGLVGGWRGGIFGSRSFDSGITWASSVKVMEILLPTARGQVGYLWDGIRALPIPSVATAPNSGLIYLAVHSAGPEGVDNADVIVAAIDPELNLVSPPVKIDDDGTSTDQFLPTLAISPTGVIGVAFYDRRVDPANKCTDLFLARSYDHGQTFHIERVTTSSFAWPPIDGQATPTGHYDPLRRAGYIGDYIDIDADGTFFYLAWAGTKDLIFTPNYPDGRLDLDVFFAKVPIYNPGPNG